MSRILVNMLSTINIFIAIVIIAVFAVIGNASFLKAGALLGAVVGFAVAAIFCGGLAALCLIERHLRVLADDLRQQRKKNASTPRIEPSVR
ncbi:hypothetical protein EN780_05720 [Mesorhizobium sp. M4B.F.Ca.ET.089.01.1.1]|uniref:hypothetical protein n=1 Tax=Mesorhizobium sp. M4B.F.Ca.ET.089.01.1.1 TaxID=2496662 RepID=UPI000FE42CB0|nr:hypothetical protein [Mesorhizobium sp. M4B.F.Ca.ET.089.01.1.1]RWX69620.1 hypothetical protein EN780_05720 [Mesorhizobium sp. M4B.F.Ca.ET.089.01.1.1]